jgi:hypothetical protein
MDKDRGRSEVWLTYVREKVGMDKDGGNGETIRVTCFQACDWLRHSRCGFLLLSLC